VIVVRELDLNKDLFEVEDLEKRCEVGNGGKISLFTDLHGDPISRVRHSPSFLMLVIHLLLYNPFPLSLNNITWRFILNCFP
jgi:hypothetical protein